MIAFFLMGRIVLKLYYNFLIIILSNAREFFNRKTIKMCEKGRLLYKPQSLSYPFISQVLKVITTTPTSKYQNEGLSGYLVGHNFQSHSLQNRHSRFYILITASNSEKLTP